MKDKRMRLLLIVSDPLDSNAASLNISEEWQSIMRATNFQQLGVDIHLITPTLHHLRQALINPKAQYDVVHFIGHGSSAGLVLEDELCCEDFVSAPDLASALIEADVKLIVLNVCESETPARELVNAGIPTVVATSGNIPDSYAITLAKELYGALVAGRSIGEAISIVQVVLNRVGGHNASELPVVIGDQALHIEPKVDRRLKDTVLRHHLPRNNLRSQAGFLGRRDELLQGVSYLADPEIRIIKISGLGGIGKSSFALELAYRCAWRFMSGVVWIDALEGSDSFSDFLFQSIKRVLPLEPNTDPAHYVRVVLRALKEQQCLLVFDDIDRLPIRIREELILFLQQVAFTSKVVLITHTYMSELDDIDGIANITLIGLDKSSSVELLTRETRAKAINELMVDSELALSRLHRIADLAGYHPKLMQIAVSLIRQVGFERTMALLSEPHEDVIEKISQLLGVSFASLDDKDVQLLQAMSTFAGDFKAEWIESLVGFKVQASIGSLINANLVERDSANDVYRLHKLVLDYALYTFDLDTQFINQHARLMAELIKQVGEEDPADRDIYLAPLEQDVISAILRLNETTDNAMLGLVIQLVSGIRDYLHFYRQSWVIIQTIEEISIRAARFLDDELALAKSLTSLGAALAAQRNFESALSHCHQGVSLIEEHGDQYDLCVAYGALGFILRRKEEYVESREAYEHALEMAKKVTHRGYIIRHLFNLSIVYDRLENWPEAEQLQRKALNLLTQMPDSRGNVIRARFIRNSLAKSLQKQNKPREAIIPLEENIASLGSADDLKEHWLLFFQLGRLYRDLKDYDRAFSCYQTALQLTEVIGHQKGMSMCLRGLGRCYQATEELRSAAEYLRQAIVISEKISDPYLPQLQQDLHKVIVQLSTQE